MPIAALGSEHVMGKTAVNVARALSNPPASGVHALRDATEGVSFRRHVAPDDLADVVEGYWLARWDLDGRAVEQEVVPAPCVNAIFGDHRPGVHGPISNRLVARLAGRGSVVGIEFRPAGFRALLQAGVEPVHLVDRPMTIGDAFAASTQVKRLGEDLAATTSDAAKIHQVSQFLRTYHPGVDDDDREVNALVDIARFDPTLTRVAGLAERADRPVRALDRLFRSRLGVAPKWVIRRFRFQEAAARIAKGLTIDLAALAFLLGYGDPSALTHDFKSQIGRTPDQHIAHCAGLR